MFVVKISHLDFCCVFSYSKYMLEIVRAAILPSAYAEGFAFLKGVLEDETSSYRHQKKKGVPRRIRPKSLGRAFLQAIAQIPLIDGRRIRPKSLGRAFPVLLEPSFLDSPKSKCPERLFWKRVAEVVLFSKG